MSTHSTIAALFAFASGFALGGEKQITLPELVASMKEQEQTDGVFRAKVSERGELKAVLLLGDLAHPEHIRALTGLDTLESLSTGCLPRAAMQEISALLGSLNHLQMLNVTSPEPAAWNLDLFKKVGALREIRQLHLGYASLPPGALQCIGQLPNLEVLELPCVQQLTPPELRQLQHCPKLTELNLRGVNFKQSGLPILLGIPSLKLVEVSHPNFGWIGNAALCAKGITIRTLSDHRDMPESPWRPWME